MSGQVQIWLDMINQKNYYIIKTIHINHTYTMMFYTNGTHTHRQTQRGLVLFDGSNPLIQSLKLNSCSVTSWSVTVLSNSVWAYLDLYSFLASWFGLQWRSNHHIYISRKVGKSWPLHIDFHQVIDCCDLQAWAMICLYHFQGWEHLSTLLLVKGRLNSNSLMSRTVGWNRGWHEAWTKPFCSLPADGPSTFCRRELPPPVHCLEMTDTLPLPLVAPRILW